MQVLDLSAKLSQRNDTLSQPDLSGTYLLITRLHRQESTPGPGGLILIPVLT